MSSQVWPHIFINKDQNLLYSVPSNDYAIQVYDISSGDLVARFGLNPGSFVKSEEYQSTFSSMQEMAEETEGQSGSRKIYASENYVYHYFQNSPMSFYLTGNEFDKEHYLSVYETGSWKLIDQIQLPFPLFTINRDELILVENDDPDNFTLRTYVLEK